MYEVGRKPTKSQAYARVICHIAGKERGLSIEVSLSETEIERLADDALRRYPKICDVRFRRMAVGRVRVFQRSSVGITESRCSGIGSLPSIRV